VPGFNGPVAITATGTLSTDGGASTTAITFSANQVVTNSQTGAVTNINSTNIRQTGTDAVNYTGTYDVFQALATLRDTLRNTQGLAPGAQALAVSQQITELDRVRQGILDVAGEQSNALKNLQALEQHVQNAQLQTQQQISNVQGADISQVLLGMQEQQNLLQMTLFSSVQVLNANLLQFLH
jgi:flagellin-like hook-associated protein FlgL